MIPSPVYLYLNRSVDKVTFDFIKIRNADTNADTNCYTLEYRPEVTKSKIASARADVLNFKAHHDLLDYLEDMLDLVLSDSDTHPYVSIDVMIPGFPIVCLKPDIHTRELIIRSVRTWHTATTSRV